MRDLRYIFHLLHRRVRWWKKDIESFNMRFYTSMKVMQTVMSAATFVSAVSFLVLILVYYGFDHTSTDLLWLHRAVRGVQGVFVANVLLAIITYRRRETKNLMGEHRVMKCVEAAVLLTLVPLLYPRPAHPWIPWLEAVVYSRWLTYGSLTVYSMLCVSYGVSQLLGRRTNPSLMLSGSFLVFIIIGSLLLMLPKCTYGSLNYIDALFVSTSAVCITGLTPIDVATTFTPMGLLVLGMLIQIGALGVLTFTCFFALFFTGNASIYNQMMLKDVVYSRSMSNLMPTLLYILGFTLAVEAIGAIAIFMSVHDTLGLTLEEELLFASFNSVSAFCNAGFSNLPGGLSNPLLLHHNQSIYWIVSLLVISGSIGFPLLVNVKEALFNTVRSHWRHDAKKRPVNRLAHKFDMNSRVVVITFAALLLAGTVFFFFSESNNTLHGFTPMERVTQSVFNSVVPRSAGFASVDPASFLAPTIIVVMFLMWVGGASQSTGGGVKVNTFAAVMLNLRAVIRGHKSVVAFHRIISRGSMRRANAVVTFSIVAYLFYAITLLLLEPALPVRALLFESLSALFTVGSSLGVTASLGVSSKLLLCTAMFMGRVGGLSLLIGVTGHASDTQAPYPEDHLIIN